MTKDQLNQKHFDKYYARSTSAATQEHTQVSIEYAISVLEELKEGYQIMTEDGVNGIPTGSIYDKIKELKSILK